MNVDAILPAGGRISGEFAAEAGAEVKALVSLGGLSLAEHTIRGLRDTGRVDRVVVVGPAEVADSPAAGMSDAVLHADQTDSGPTNIIRGIEWLREARGGRYPDRVLVVTTDLPFLSSHAVTGFMDACPGGSDICVPLVSREEYLGRFPGSTNLFVKMRDGEWTIGCAFMVNPEAVARNQPLVEQVFQARKSQIGMARLLGPSLIVRFLTRRLTVPLVERRCKQILGCTASAVRGCSPDLSFDMDYLEDYRYALQAIGAGGRS